MLEQQNTIMIHSDRRHKEETQDLDRSTDHLPHMRNAYGLAPKKKQPPAPPAPAPAPLPLLHLTNRLNINGLGTCGRS